jgi:hypothetical protein
MSTMITSVIVPELPLRHRVPTRMRSNVVARPLVVRSHGRSWCLPCLALTRLINATCTIIAVTRICEGSTSSFGTVLGVDIVQTVDTALAVLATDVDVQG